MLFDLNLLHNNGHNGYHNSISTALHETGVIEKLLTSYRFIQSSERQHKKTILKITHSCSLGNLKWHLVASILGALFGAFNATGNCKIHFLCLK
uniref:Uncharacterized protein n=1 Tax=Rhinolophus ferrumequinum TaxID=59479 RepID=A0A671DRN3_RHIFE